MTFRSRGNRSKGYGSAGVRVRTTDNGWVVDTEHATPTQVVDEYGEPTYDHTNTTRVFTFDQPRELEAHLTEFVTQALALARK